MKVMVMVRVCIRVYVMIIFCRNIALFSLFYAFHIYIPHSVILYYTRTRGFFNLSHGHYLQPHSLYHNNTSYR